MCDFLAQLVEHRTGIAEVTGSNPVEALIIFFQASSFQLLKLEDISAMVTLHFHLQPQYRYELFDIDFIRYLIYQALDKYSRISKVMCCVALKFMAARVG